MSAPPERAPLAALPAPLAVPPAASEHPAAVYLARLAPSGRRTMATSLDTIARLLTGGQADAYTLPWGQLRYAHTQAVRTALAERYAPATANKHLSALRGVLTAAWRLEQISAEDHARACDLEPVRGSTLPAGRSLSQGELGALFGVCANDPSPGGARDGALLALLYAGGVRRGEAVDLNLADYDPETGTLRVLRGKGRKDREVYVTGGAANAVDAWIDERSDEPGPLVCPVDRIGRITIRRLGAEAIRHALTKRAKQAGIANFTPHDLRRTFVGDLLDAGADIVTVQALAGHASPFTTARYDRRPAATRRRAAELLHVPYTRP